MEIFESPSLDFFMYACIVVCQCVVQAGSLVPGCPWEVPLKVKACDTLLFAEGSLKVEIDKNGLSKL